MKKWMLIFILLSAWSFALSAEEKISEEKKQLIDQLLTQTGQSALNVGNQFSSFFVQQMTVSLKQARPDVDPKAFDIIEDVVNATIREKMVLQGSFTQMIYPIYDKHFSNEELQQIIEFNETELGQKLIRVMPQITQEGMQAGQAFGQSLAPIIEAKIKQRFEEEGIDLE